MKSSEKDENKKADNRQKLSNYDRSNCISKLYCLYIFPFLYRNYQKANLSLDSIDACNRNDRCQALCGQLLKHWKAELEKKKTQKVTGKCPNLLLALLRTFGPQYLFQNFKNFLCYGVFRMAMPLFLGRIIHYANLFYEEVKEVKTNSSMSTESSALKYGDDIVDSNWFELGNRDNVILNSVFLGLMIFINFLISHPVFMCEYRYGMHCRVAVTRLIYGKALKITGGALQRATSGKVTNLISNDANRFDMGYIYICYLYLAPIVTVVGIWLLYTYIGRSAFGALALVLVYIPFQTVMANILSRLRSASASLTDDRLRLMAEILPAMRVIKMYFWEKSFARLVHKARKLEITKIKHSMTLRSLNLALYFVAPKIIAFVCIIIFYADGGKLNAENVFVTLSLVGHLREVITYLFPMGISNSVELYISIKRIELFLLEEEISKVEKVFEEKEDQNPILTETPTTPLVIFKNLRVSSEEGVPILRDITFTALSGQLTVIIGPVGSGKSSLLLSMLNELPNSGISIAGISGTPTIAYSSQEAWIFGGSIRENILFGRHFNAERYRLVVKAAALKTDFAQFTSGDLTVVEERGVSLSGGQRARVSLARALYTEADVYALDDPLSAVDATVARHIFEKAIKGPLLRSKVVILVTHLLQFVKQADLIVVLKEGTLLTAGSYIQLLNRHIDLYKYSEGAAISTAEASETSFSPETFHQLSRTDSTGSAELFRTCSRSNSVLSESDFEDNTSILEYMNPSTSITPQFSRLDSTISVGDDNDFENSIQNQTSFSSSEDSSVSKNKLKTYWIYISAGSSLWFFIIFIFVNLVTQILFTGSDYWLSAWTDFKEKSVIQEIDSNFTFTRNPIVATTDNQNILIYSVLVGSLFIFSILRTVSYFSICMKSSVVLHNRIFSSLMEAPIAFFDQTPIGIILNRVSRDLGIVDDILPPTAFSALEILLNSAAVFILISILNYLVVFPFLILMALIYFANRFYVDTARKLKHLEAVARSPLFSQMSSTLNGLATIRSYKREDLLLERFEQVQDRHSAAYFTFISASRLYGIFLEAICVVYVYVLILVLNFKLTDYTGAIIGLTISQSLQLTNVFNYGIRMYTEVETYMTSIERIAEFGQLEGEKQLEEGPVEPDPSWPETGEIVFEDVSLSYKSSTQKEGSEKQEEDTIVLKNLNFIIQGGEKVGIIGRTGAGKSSLINALFRLSPLDNGRILIDGIDISQISLQRLRQESLSIIPQEPVLFSGSLRRNLDPFNEQSDAQIWEALDKVQLKGKVKDTAALDNEATLVEGEFSVGQKQLLCLARALLRKNRVLVLDEVTANVDPRTDALIQVAIRSEMDSTQNEDSGDSKKLTVLTIAHRLHTIIDYDRVLVLDSGNVVQFDCPHLLIQAKKGVFYELYSSLGSDARIELAKVAERAFNSRKIIRE